MKQPGKMKKFLMKTMYLLWDNFLALILIFITIAGSVLIGLIPMLIGMYTSWNWVALLTLITGPYAIILMLIGGDAVIDWFDERQTIGKEIERGIF